MTDNVKTVTQKLLRVVSGEERGIEISYNRFTLHWNIQPFNYVFIFCKLYPILLIVQYTIYCDLKEPDGTAGLLEDELSEELAQD